MLNNTQAIYERLIRGGFLAADRKWKWLLLFLHYQ